MIIKVMDNGNILRIRNESWDKYSYVEFDGRGVRSGFHVAMIYFPTGATVQNILDGQIAILMPKPGTQAERKEPANEKTLGKST